MTLDHHRRFAPRHTGDNAGRATSPRPTLRAYLARLDFPPDLGGTGPVWLDARVTEQLIASSEELLRGFARCQRKSPGIPGYVPILIIRA